MRTHDGASIAYTDVGSGLPLVALPVIPFSHLQRAQASTMLAGWATGLGRGRRLMQYDARGTGLSDRDHVDFSLEAQVRDLERLLDQLDLERAALLGVLHAGAIASAFAAAHPDRVSHLLLWHAYPRGTDMFRDPRMRAVGELIQKNWELFTDAVTFTNFGWTAGPSASEFAELARAAVTPDAGREAFGQFARYDVTAELGRITAPTLVLSREAPLAPTLDIARDLVAAIPDAQLMLVEGGGIAPWIGEVSTIHEAIDAFLPASATVRAPHVEGLSTRELEVLALLSAGMSNQQIADQLIVSVGTVKSHVSNILTKLQATNRTEAVARARAADLIR